jgi:hypothetical protein
MDHLTLFESVCGLHSPKIMWCIIIFSLKHALKKLGALSSMLIQTIWQSRVDFPLPPVQRLHSTRGSRVYPHFRMPLRISRKLMIQTRNNFVLWYMIHHGVLSHGVLSHGGTFSFHPFFKMRCSWIFHVS